MGLITNATSGILTGVSTKVGAITTMARGILCIPQILSPTGLKYLTASIGQFLTAYGANVITSLANFVTATVTRNIQNITGVITTQLNAINNFIKDIRESIQLIKNYATQLLSESRSIWNHLSDQLNCNFAAAELAKCLISDILDELPKSVSRQLSDGTLNLNNKVLDITDKLRGPEKSITRFTHQAQTFANKARIQQLF
jgi:conjugal transfer/entry exclusion protein